mmetsp:Transcript_12167/g.16072  ORF Transcript_12167/g.16072 Transcript_12167/m.16072 type:complete len:282 (-) Transcript_12167:54-899(-)
MLLKEATYQWKPPTALFLICVANKSTRQCPSWDKYEPDNGNQHGNPVLLLSSVVPDHRIHCALQSSWISHLFRRAMASSPILGSSSSSTPSRLFSSCSLSPCSPVRLLRRPTSLIRSRRSLTCDVTMRLRVIRYTIAFTHRPSFIITALSSFDDVIGQGGGGGRGRGDCEQWADSAALSCSRLVGRAESHSSRPFMARIKAASSFARLTGARIPVTSLSHSSSPESDDAVTLPPSGLLCVRCVVSVSMTERIVSLSITKIRWATTKSKQTSSRLSFAGHPA